MAAMSFDESFLGELVDSKTANFKRIFAGQKFIEID
jgi:hypothetical protein